MTMKKPFFSSIRSQVGLRKLKRRQQGQTLVEYALILAFISVVAISVLVALGQHARALYSMINSQVNSANNQ